MIGRVTSKIWKGTLPVVDLLCPIKQEWQTFHSVAGFIHVWIIVSEDDYSFLSAEHHKTKKTNSTTQPIYNYHNIKLDISSYGLINILTLIYKSISQWVHKSPYNGVCNNCYRNRILIRLDS